MLRRMERDGWIMRERDAADHRVVRVHLTRKAKDFRREAGATFRKMEDELADVYTEDEQATLRRLLLKLHDHFAPEAAGKAHPPFFGGLDEEESA